MKNNQNQVIGGIVLITMGVAAILSFSGIDILGLSPWLVWGLLVPIMGGLVMAYQRLQENGGRIDGRFLQQNLWLLFPLVIAVFFLFNINWAYFGALFFIGGGVMLLVGQGSEKEF